LPNPRPQPTLSSLIAAMSRPEFFSERPDSVELVQTHISCVFIAGNFVYKIKKPVRFAFLDYSTLEQRYHFAQEEVRLNRRLAPDIYLGVFPILYREGGFALGAEESAGLGGSDVAEYAVKMRRLPEDRILERMVGEKRAGKADMVRIAERLVSFHAAAAFDRAAVYGAPPAVRDAVLGNIAECEACVGKTLSRSEFERIEAFLRRFIASHEELLWERAERGRVREGHGDLRCEHICLTDGIVVFDCLEFSERLRYCDVASEIAFLAMDLDRLGASELAAELVAEYAARTGDDALAILIRFYKCHRAAVRGKVATLKSLEAEVPDAERARARELALTSFHLANRYASGAAPAIVIVCGLAGTGKSTIAKAIANRVGLEVFNSDVIRKRLAGLEPTERAGAAYRAAIYDDRSTERTYDALLAEAEKSLDEGKGVIIDATFKNPAYRRRFAEMGERRGVPILIVECRASEEEVMRRLIERGRRPGEVSDATPEVYLRQKAEFVPVSEVDERHHLVVEGEQDSEQVAIRIEAMLDGMR
jgi:aminoglycoside phosphotransferase family enzyme/predicted kinase